MEITEEITENIPEPESEPEEMQEEKRSRADDASAMQAAVCLVLGLALLITDIFLPETAAAFLEKLKQLSGDIAFTLPDPVEWVISHWQG